MAANGCPAPRRSDRRSDDEFRSDETVKGSSGGTPEYDCNLRAASDSTSSSSCGGASPPRRPARPCATVDRWRRPTRVRDACGAGALPKRRRFRQQHELWCGTPLSMYQATIGDLGRRLLCREEVVQRNIFPEPPCTVSDQVQPPCRGYYRRYECLRPCEEEYAVVDPHTGHRVYRSRADRYWDPCPEPGADAPQSASLAAKLRRRNDGSDCW